MMATLLFIIPESAVKESCLTRGTQRRIVFFDLDGTLHQQDMFGTFMRYLLRRRPLNLLLVVPLLPVVGIGLLFKGRAARWPMSLLLWSITFGRSEQTLLRLEAEFAQWFRLRVKAFPMVQQRLTDYLGSDDADVWLITGSPQSLVEQVYYDSAFLPRVKRIARQMRRGWGGREWASVPVRGLGPTGSPSPGALTGWWRPQWTGWPAAGCRASMPARSRV